MELWRSRLGSFLKELYDRFVGAVTSTAKDNMSEVSRQNMGWDEMMKVRVFTLEPGWVTNSMAPNTSTAHIIKTSRDLKDFAHNTKVKRRIKSGREHIPYSPLFCLEEISKTVSDIRPGKSSDGTRMFIQNRASKDRKKRKGYSLMGQHVLSEQ